MATLLAAAILLVSFAPGAGAQPKGADQPWVTFERAEASLEAGDLGRALELFQKVEAAGQFVPDVEMAMGDIFRSQAEPELAEWHYRRAYELKGSFRVPGDRYTVLYKLADMDRDLGRYPQMEKVLLDALNEDPHYQFQSRRNDVTRIFRENGLDRVLALYRFPDALTAPAHSGLAWYYARSGRPAEAIDHALFSIVIVLSRAIDEMKRSQPFYRFDTVSSFLAFTEREPDLLSFLEGSTLPADFYSLGVALAALGDAGGAARAWHLLSGSPLEGRWRDLADRQLAHPFSERLPQPAGPSQQPVAPPRR